MSYQSFMSEKTNITKHSKRKYNEAFECYYENDRYDQPIDNKFFNTNIGHGVYVEKSGHESVTKPKNVPHVVDNVISDFREAFDLKKLEALGRTFVTIEETIEWCEMYLTLSGKQIPNK